MNLNIKHFVSFVTILFFLSCKEQPTSLKQIVGKEININDSIAPKDSILSYVLPFTNRINAVLDSTIAYAPNSISKDDGELNTTAGNLMADITLAEANPIFLKRTGKNIDFVLLNFGGIRSIISKGNINRRTAYEVMPFENNIVVAALKGASVRKLVSYLVNGHVPHPISGLQVVLDKDDKLQFVNIQGKPFNEDQTYYVATSNYLLNGGDNMNFFKEATEVTDLNYLIRNAMIDYFMKVDTVAPVVDGRFKKI